LRTLDGSVPSGLEFLLARAGRAGDVGSRIARLRLRLLDRRLDRHGRGRDAAWTHRGAEVRRFDAARRRDRGAHRGITGRGQREGE
jgi:hypothetical protein